MRQALTWRGWIQDGMSLSDIERRTGVKRRRVGELLKLLELPEEVLWGILDGAPVAKMGIKTVLREWV